MEVSSDNFCNSLSDVLKLKKIFVKIDLCIALAIFINS